MPFPADASLTDGGSQCQNLCDIDRWHAIYGIWARPG